MVLQSRPEKRPLTPALSPTMKPMGRGRKQRALLLGPPLQGEGWVGMVCSSVAKGSPLLAPCPRSRLRRLPGSHTFGRLVAAVVANAKSIAIDPHCGNFIHPAPRAPGSSA